MVRRTRSISGGRAQAKYLVRGMAAPVLALSFWERLQTEAASALRALLQSAVSSFRLCRVSAALQRPARARHLDRRIGSSLNLQPAKAKRLRKTIDCRTGRPSGGTKAGSWGCVGGDPALVPDAATCLLTAATNRALHELFGEYAFQSNSHGRIWIVRLQSERRGKTPACMPPNLTCVNSANRRFP